MSDRRDRPPSRRIRTSALILVIPVLVALSVAAGILSENASSPLNPIAPSQTSASTPTPPATPSSISAPTPPSPTTSTTQEPTTATLSMPELRLAVLGDVGTGDAHELATARLVSEAAAAQSFDGLVLLGDNVYPSGNPERLDATVFRPFGPLLQEGTALMAVLGNHDVGHVDGQLASLGMPGRWYRIELGSLLLVALDSNIVGNPEQQAWLETTLAGADADWVIVAMHHPAFSAGYHGETDSVQEAWVPLFERYGVDLVLAGHDHDYQRSTPIGGVTYIVSGAAAKLRPTGKAEYTAYSESIRHFVDVAIWADRMEITAIAEGGPFDHVTIEAR